MPSGAVPVPEDPVTKKREVGGYESSTKDGHTPIHPSATVDWDQTRTQFSRRGGMFNLIALI